MNPTTPTTKAAEASTDNRGISEILGAVLLFAIVILALTLVQVHFIPTANQQVEFEHNQRIQGDMLEFSHKLSNVVASGVAESSSLELTAYYPSRFLFLNPAPATGTFESVDRGVVTIANARASSAAKHWNGTDQRYTTTTYQYRNGYNQYDLAPDTVYEHGALVNEFPHGEGLPLDAASLVSGDTITVTTVAGNISRSGGSRLSLEAVPLSGPAQAMDISNEPMQDIVLTLPISLSAPTWRSLLQDELAPRGNIKTLSVTDGVLNLTLEPGSYDLRMARVGIASASNRPRVPAHYIATTDSQNRTIRSDETARVAVEIRDAFNNPTSGTVTFSATNGVFLSDEGDVESVDISAGRDGDAGAVFQPTDPGPATITVQGDFDGDGPEKLERKVIEFDVVSPLGPNASEINEGLSSINPTRPVQLIDVSTKSETIYLTFTNPTSETATMQEARFSFYYTDQSSINRATALQINGDDFPLFADFKGVSNGVSLGPGETKTIQIGSNGKAVQGDIFGLSVKWGGIKRATYFIPT